MTAVAQSIVRHRPFALYRSARTATAMGFQILGVAVDWQMYALTGSALDLGLVASSSWMERATTSFRAWAPACGLAEPMVEERGEPGTASRIIDCAIGEMRHPRLGVGQQRAIV